MGGTSLKACIKGRDKKGLQTRRTLTHNQDLPDVVTSQEELDVDKTAKQILNVPIIEDALQSELWPALQLQRVRAGNVISIIRRIRSSIFGMKKCQHHATWLDSGSDPLHCWFHKRLVQVFGDGPA